MNNERKKVKFLKSQNSVKEKREQAKKKIANATSNSTKTKVMTKSKCLDTLELQN